MFQTKSFMFKDAEEFWEQCNKDKWHVQFQAEVATTGVEGLMSGAGDRYGLMEDDGFRHFILGLMGGF